MTQLEDLIHSLITLIIRYHDSQAGVKKIIIDSDLQQASKKSRRTAIELFCDEGMDLEKQLSDLIKKSTSGYSGRHAFLSFILHEILFLKTICNQKKSLDPKQLKETIEQLAQLFIDFKKLLNTSKAKECPVNYSHFNNGPLLNCEKKISLSGLMNDARIGNKLCNSGCLLKEVLERLNIAANSTQDELELVAQNLCAEYQNTLLVPELQINTTQLKQQQDELKENLEDLNRQLQQTQTEIIKNVVKIQLLEKTVSDQVKKSSEFKSTIAQLEKTITTQAEQSFKDKATIEELEQKRSNHNTQSPEVLSEKPAIATNDAHANSTYSLFFYGNHETQKTWEGLMPFLGVADINETASRQDPIFRE